jgi:putative flippase GtrA
MKFEYTTATVIAWVIAVTFAYITNKLFVFESKSFDLSLIAKELITFVSSRLFSGLCELAFMIFAVGFIHMNDFLAKIITNVFVVIINYIASKLFVFKER